MWRAQPKSNRLPPQTVSFRVGSRYRPGPGLHKPPCDPGRSDFPSPVLISALPRQPSRRQRCSSAGSHPPLPTSVCSHDRPRLGWHLSAALRPGASRTWNRQVPRAPLPAEGVTSTGATSRAASKGVTPPSSLLRAHAPDHAPPLAFGPSLGPGVCAGCCQPRLRRGPSRRYLCESFPGCSDPLPRQSPWCSRSFLPMGHRPSPR